MRTLLTALFIFTYLVSCKKTNTSTSLASLNVSPITCDNKGCIGIYEGPEFINRSDVAHQFSNTMAAMVGDQLKVLYRKNQYKKVDFSKIQMSTKGMGSGQVLYSLSIPFISVKEKCDAYTSFDHVGGWNHSPELVKRKEQLSHLLLDGESLSISTLKRTKEGLQEYWIQWKNKELQKKCIY